jgi:predicted transcriptional regulator
MRTTVRLDDDLLREAKALAARRGRTLTSLIEDGLREQLVRAEQSPTRREIKIPTWRGGELRPGVDLDDNAATWDLLDEGVPLDKLR